MPDNRGAIRVYVPAGQELPQEPVVDNRADIHADGAIDVQAIVSAKDEVIAGHLAHVGTLKDALAKAETRADAAEAQVGELRQQLTEWQRAGWWRRRRIRAAWRGHD
jgi:hypothetical protein